jgi:type IV secretion system protein VirD4
MTRTPLYHKPLKPGYLGGHNWPAAIIGLLLMVVANWLSTQYIAQEFHFQQALGEPCFRVRALSVYQPFAWIVWGWQYVGDSDPAIRRPFLMGLLILLAGSFFAVAVAFSIANRRSRSLSRNADQLHGSARFRTAKEVLRSRLATTKTGVFVGGFVHKGRLHYLRHDGPEHVLLFAPTRSGKGVSLVIPTCLAWEGSMVAYDIKGELFDKTSGCRASRNHAVLNFAPVQAVPSSRFNPLQEIRLFTDRDVSDAQNLALMLVTTEAKQASDIGNYFKRAACSLLTCMILHKCYEAAAENRIATLAELYAFMNRPGIDFHATLAELLDYPHDSAGQCNWTDPQDGSPTVTHPVVCQTAQEMLNKESKDFGGVLSTSNAAVQMYCDPLVSRNTACSDFRIDDLVNHERPVTLYITVPSSDEERLRPLTRLLFTMIVNRLTEKMHSRDDKRNLHRLLFLIDEFPSLGHMEIFSRALSYMGGYDMKAFLITQDIRQVVDSYGPQESIVSNCQVRVAFAPNQPDTARLLSDMTGTTTIQKATYSFSGKSYGTVMGNMNASVDNVQRPLLTPDEVSRIKGPTKVGEGAAERITEPGDLLLFTSGEFPIHGTMPLYFKDRILAAWSEMTPPTEFPRLLLPGDAAEFGLSELPQLPDTSGAEQMFLDGLYDLAMQAIDEEEQKEEEHNATV